jgi:hypothetical protein
MTHRRNIAAATALFAAIAACGSEEPGGVFPDGASSGGQSSNGGQSSGFGGVQDAGKPDVDQFASDPPPPWCGPAGQPEPMKPGGTLECPDDKNKPGCPCATPDQEVSCWTGLRKHRSLGVCKDGKAKCIRTSETTFGWSACEGQVLPTPGATKGAAACGCFSKGQWKIANTSPCFINNGAAGANSTVIDGGGVAKCLEPPTSPPTLPSTPWSPNTLNVDCAGKFKLCYAIKAGTFETPSAADCKLAEVCTETDYPTANVEQAFPALPAWVSNDTACATKFATTGGYGEMTVIGKSVRCDVVDDGAGKPLMFNRVKYCPLSCNANPAAPECMNCQQGGSGSF